MQNPLADVPRREPVKFDRIPLESSVHDWLFTLPALLLSTVLTAVLYVCSFLWILQFTGVESLARANRFLIVYLTVHILAFKLMYVKYFTRAQVVFLCYPPAHLWGYVKPCTQAASWFWKEKPMVISDLSWEGKSIGYIVVMPPLALIKDSPAIIQYYIEYCLDMFKGAKIALGGQLPAVAHRMGLPAAMHKDIVNGRVGTVALARRGAQRGVEILRESFPEKFANKKDVKMCVIGGGGFTGKEIAGACSDLFSNIYMVDTRFSDGDVDLKVEEGAEVLGTADQSYVSKADVVFIFLPKGDLVEPYIKHAHKEQVWIDDTHPPMTKRVSKMLAEKTFVRRLAAYSKKMGMWPKLTGWRPQDLPGCLLTAQVLSLTKVELKAGTSIAQAKTGKSGVLEFIELADSIGVQLDIFPFEEDEEFKAFGVNIVTKESKKKAI